MGQKGHNFAERSNILRTSFQVVDLPLNTKKAHLVTELAIIPNREDVLMLSD